jgi:hypothetical protein
VRRERRRRCPLTSTDPLWTAVFSLLPIGIALRASTLVGMAVTILGVVLISRWMEGAAGAAGWGLGPVLVQMAEGAYGEPSAFMMLESQLIATAARLF